MNRLLFVMPFTPEIEQLKKFYRDGVGLNVVADSPFGLAAGVWTKDVKKAHHVARRLQAGTVWINAYNFYDAGMPFGGYKSSGFGRDLGPECLRDYTQVKSVWMNLE